MKVIPIDKVTPFIIEVPDLPTEVVSTFTPHGPARTIADALLYLHEGYHVDGVTRLFTTQEEYARREANVAAWMDAKSLLREQPDAATREAWIWLGWTDNVSPFGYAAGEPHVKVNPGITLQTLIDTYDPSKIPGGGDE